MPPPKTPTAPSPSPSDPTITTGPIPEPVLRAILAADEAMYPASLPWSRLQAWVDACPALAVCFHYHHHRHHQHRNASDINNNDEDDVVTSLGASITLPLRAGPWRALLTGRLAEPAIRPGHLCRVSLTTRGGEEGIPEEDGEEGDDDGDDDDEKEGVVGLHVFHVERFDDDDDDDDDDVVARRRAGRGLAARALRHALDVAAGRGWRVLGCSALTATDAGARAFAKLGFEPTGYEEVWVREVGAAGPARLVPIMPSVPPAEEGRGGRGGGGAVRERGDDEEVVGEAKMVVRYSDGVQDGGGLI